MTVNLHPKKRYVFSNRKTLTLREREYPQENLGLKPNGLWYSVGAAWREWTSTEWPDRANAERYVHEITFHPGRILILDTAAKVLDLTRRFPNAEFPGNRRGFAMALDWKAIAAAYPGIEIAPYQHGLRLDPRTSWYYGWDVASGVVWDLTAVKSVRYVGLLPLVKSQFDGVA